MFSKPQNYSLTNSFFFILLGPPSLGKFCAAAHDHRSLKKNMKPKELIKNPAKCVSNDAMFYFIGFLLEY